MTTHVQSRRRRITLALHLMLIAAFAGIGILAKAQGPATITTDLEDYPPGATVIITGSGFQAGENVTLLVEHVGEDPTGTDPETHQPWTVIADGEGNVVSSWDVPIDGDALGATFLLTADGETSWLHAETQFTDANLNSVEVLAQVGTLTYGTAGTATYTVNVRATGGAGGFTATLGIIGLPIGVTYSFSAPSLFFPNATTLSSTLTLTTLSSTPAASSPYTFTVTATNGPTTRDDDGTLTINKKAITGGITASNKEYDGTTAATVVGSFSGIISGDAVTVTVDAATFNNKDVGTAKPVSATVTLTGAAAGNYSVTSPATTTADITRKQLTPVFTVSNKPYDGNTSATILTRSLIGVIGTENVTLVGGTATFDTKDAGVGKTVTGTGFTLNGNAATLANYQLSAIPPTTTANIDKKGITVTASSGTKIYGSIDPFFIYSTPPGSLAPGDGISGSLTRVAGENVGSYPIIQDVGNPITIDPASSIPNYIVNFVPGNLSITPVPLTITAEDKSKVYDGLVYTPFTVAYSGFVNGDDENDLSGILTFSGSATTNTSFGNNYKIVPAGLTSGNYTISFVQGTLNITRRPITIIVNSLQTKVYGDVNPTYTYSVGGDGLAITDQFNGALARAVGENVGSYAINQGTLSIINSSTLASVSNNYTTTFTGANFTITSLGVTVTADPQAKTYGNVDPALTFVSSPAVGSALANGLLVSFTGSLIRLAGENVGPYAIDQGSVANSNYTISYTGAILNITPLDVTVTADAKTKTYGDVDPALTFVSNPVEASALANGLLVSFTGSLTRDAGEDVGPYAINQGNVDNTNYTITYVGADLTITPLDVTVTADANSKTYGALDPALTFVSSPAVGFVLPNGSPISFTGSLVRDAGEDVGPYAINQGNVDNTNYTITYVGANLTITPLSVTVTTDAKAKTYGALDPALTFVSSPAVGFVLPNGSPISFTGSLVRDAGEDVGPYAINQGNVDNTNYTITYVGADLTITPLDATVTADAKSKTYGALDPALTFVSSPAVGFVLPNGSPISFTGSLTRDGGENVGPYAINQGSVDNTNYTITYVGADLTITPLGVTVTADAKSKTYGALDPALTFVSSPAVGFVLPNGSPISFTGSLTREGGENVGPYAINQGSVDNTNYTITYVGADLTITPLGVTVTADAKSKTYGALDPALTFVSSPAVGFVLPNGSPISFTGSLTRDGGENVGSYAINQGSVDNTNYAITYIVKNLTITPLDVTVTAAAKTKSHGDLDPALTYVSSPAVGSLLANGEQVSFTGSLTRLSGENVGSYAINQGNVANSNYTITYFGASLTITPLAVTVTADAKTKTYGDPDPALTFVSSPVVGSALANGLLISFTGSLTRDAGEDVGNYAIKKGSVANSNYTITYVGANLTISPASLTITANNKTKYCGQEVTFLGTEFSVSGIKFTDAVNSVTLTSAGAASTASGSGSPYSIVPSAAVGTGLGNYTIGYVNGSLSILAVTIDASANSTPQAVKTTSTVITASITQAVAGVYVTFKVDGVVKGTSQTTAAGLASLNIGVLAVEVYKIEVTAGADCSNSTAYLPVYDPTAGFVTGGGWFISPIVNTLPYMQVSGKANFGFVSKYLKGSNTPTGNTEFQFQAGSLNFASSSYDLGSLVVTSTKAIYKGTGKINGAGNYGFMVSALDGGATGGGGIDKFRIKIWDINSSGAIVYDNNAGLDDNGVPTTALGGGSIVIHTPNGKNSSAREANEAGLESTPIQLDETISIEAYPNPMKSVLSVKVANPASEVVSIHMIDVAGRTMWMKQPEATTEEVYTIDTNQWPSGLYILQVKVGRAGKTMKLLKE